MKLKLIRYTEDNGLTLPVDVVESDEHFNTPNLIKFRVNMDKIHHRPQNDFSWIDHTDGNFKATLAVFVDDKDVDKRSYNDLQSSIQIKVSTVLELHSCIEIRNTPTLVI